MNRDLKLALFLVLVVFIVSACNNYQNPFQKKDREEVGRGLKLSFEQNTIPDIIYIGQEFPISVLVENFGPEIDGRLRIFDQIDGGDVAYDQTITIPMGEFVEDSLGRIRGQIISGKIRVPRDQSEKRVMYRRENVFDGARANIHAELTIDNYPVKERFPLCLKEGDVEGVPCNNNEIETFADARTQYRAMTYSPVTIDRVEKTVTPLGNDEYFIALDITLINEGGGDIISSDLTGRDDFRILDNAINTPEVSFGGQSLRCSPQNEVVFVDKKSTLNCVGTTSLQEGQEYVERITLIDYTFNYKMKIKKGPIPIIDRNNGN